MEQTYYHRIGMLVTILLWFTGYSGSILADTFSGNNRNNQIQNAREWEKNNNISPLPAPTPLVSIIIDDLGHLRVAGLRAINLPGALSFSFLPNTPYAQELSDTARKLGKEILVHIPMQSQENHCLGSGGLTKDMTRAELTVSIHASMNTIPHARGLSNHMGSLLTKEKKHMRWLMEAILEYSSDFYFVDNRTTPHTVAATTAREYGIPTLERDVFLDHEPNIDFIQKAINKLIREAKKKGTALGVAHPYPETLDTLSHALPKLQDRGVILVPVSTLLAVEQARKKTQSVREAEIEEDEHCSPSVLAP